MPYGDSHNPNNDNNKDGDNPVYVGTDNTLMYHGKRMEPNHMYFVEWQGMKLGLVRTVNEQGKEVVDFYEFHPNLIGKIQVFIKELRERIARRK